MLEIFVGITQNLQAVENQSDIGRIYVAVIIAHHIYRYTASDETAPIFRVT